MSTRVKIEPEEEVRPGTSGGDVRPKQQPKMAEKMVKEVNDSEETLDSDDIDDEFLTQYCETVDSVQPMTVSKELFYTTVWWPETMSGCPKKTRSALIK